MLRNINIDLVYQPLIDAPPISADELYASSSAGDKKTCDTWRKTWIENFKKAKERFGTLGDYSYGKLYGINRHKPMICIASGPSLKNALPVLKENKQRENPVKSISTLHNFGLLEDEGCHADYYLSLDSGGVVIDDVSESRNKDGGFYWEKTKGHKLIAYAASDPRLFDLWQGEIYLFNCLVPDMDIRQANFEVENFAHFISSGGNAGGACMYTAKCVMGSTDIIFVGYDYCFDYDNKFHSYSTHYDVPGQYMLAHDVYGMMRKTWGSYFGFKMWMDSIVMKIPGRWTNCSEGILGAYATGNLKHYTYMPLRDALVQYWMADEIFWKTFDSKTKQELSNERINLGEFFAKPAQDRHLTLF